MSTIITDDPVATAGTEAAAVHTPLAVRTLPAGIVEGRAPPSQEEVSHQC